MVGGGISLGTPGGSPGVRNPGGGGGEGVGYVIGPGGGVTLTSISRSDGVAGGGGMGTLQGIGGGGFIVSRRLLITRSRIQYGIRGSGRGPGPLPHGIHLPLVDI
jgi:hypothetical protein